jgi:hypothetical protein
MSAEFRVFRLEILDEKYCTSHFLAVTSIGITLQAQGHISPF